MYVIIIIYNNIIITYNVSCMGASCTLKLTHLIEIIIIVHIILYVHACMTEYPMQSINKELE